MLKKALLLLAFILVIYFGNELYLSRNVTGSNWETKVWNLDPGSDSKFNSGTFQGTAIKNSSTDFGTASIQQGVMPHKWYTSSAGLRKELTLYRDADQPLYLTAKVKRIGEIEWYSSHPDKRWNNIGLDIMGDVGLDYGNDDITQPHALVIDFYHDTDAVSPYYYQGAGSYDRDYRAGYPLAASRLDTDTEYYFKTRIDGYIKDAMNHYGFEYFTIKYTEYYIEAKASMGSVTACDIALTTS